MNFKENKVSIIIGVALSIVTIIAIGKVTLIKAEFNRFQETNASKNEVINQTSKKLYKHIECLSAKSSLSKRKQLEVCAVIYKAYNREDCLLSLNEGNKAQSTKLCKSIFKKEEY